MEEILEIGGKEYTFVANRKALALASMFEEKGRADLDANMDLLDNMFYVLLKTRHNLTKKQVSEVLDVAEEEYDVADLMNFCSKLLEKVFTKGEEKKKTIAFLSQK